MQLQASAAAVPCEPRVTAGVAQLPFPVAKCVRQAVCWAPNPELSYRSSTLSVTVTQFYK